MTLEEASGPYASLGLDLRIAYCLWHIGHSIGVPKFGEDPRSVIAVINTVVSSGFEVVLIGHALCGTRRSWLMELRAQCVVDSWFL